MGGAPLPPHPPADASLAPYPHSRGDPVATPTAKAEAGGRIGATPKPQSHARRGATVPRTFASRLSAVAPSITLAMNTRALEMKSRGFDVFAFGVGEPDFEPPAHVLEAAKHA